MNELQTLRQLRAQVTPRGDDGLNQQRERLLAEITSTPRRFRWLHGMRPRADRFWVPALAGALTLALLLGVILVQTQRNDALSVPHPNQWFYREVLVTSSGEDEGTYLQREEWHRADYQQSAVREERGELEIRDQPLAGTFFSDLEELYEFYRSLPDEPDAVVDAVYDRVDDEVAWHCSEEGPGLRDVGRGESCEEELRTSGRRDSWVFDLFELMLTQGAPPPELQARLYQALSRVPDVEDDGMVEDAAGRNSVALGAESIGLDNEPEGRQQLLFDPDDHTFRASRVIGENGTTSVTVLTVGIVDEAGDRP